VTSTWLTNETADVTNIQGYNSGYFFKIIPSISCLLNFATLGQDTLYYTVAATPIDRSLSSIPFTCSPSPTPSPSQRVFEGPHYYSASFSPSSDYYLLGDLGDGSFTDVPTYTIYSASLGNANFTPEMVQSNGALAEFVANASLGTRQFFQIPSADGVGERDLSRKESFFYRPSIYFLFQLTLLLRLIGPIFFFPEMLEAVVWYPPGYPSRRGEGHYDYVVRVYGGPGSQTVSRRYALGYDLYLASSLEVFLSLLNGIVFSSNDCFLFFFFRVDTSISFRLWW
jgi:dipeptidyl aminopeptidase/acylaminoacyl peptidase